MSAALADAGVPAELADVLAGNDLGTGRGELFTNSGDLRRLIGRPATTLADASAGQPQQAAGSPLSAGSLGARRRHTVPARVMSGCAGRSLRDSGAA